MLKRVIGRPWGRRHKGGWIIQPESLIKCLKDGDAVEIGKVQVGTKNLIQLIRLLDFPDQELLIHSNGALEVQNIARIFQMDEAKGHRVCEFRRPKIRKHYFSLYNKAWLPKDIKVLVVIKPKKFG